MQKTEHNLIVHKFGGSSLANAERFTALKSLLQGQKEIIVVSAIQGTTSTLQTLIDKAKGNESFLNLLDDLKTKHLNLVKMLLSEDQRVGLEISIQNDFSAIEDILNSIQLSGFCSLGLQEFILGYGEIWSAKILHIYLSLYKKVIYLDASTILATYEKNSMKFIDWEKSQIALNVFLENQSFDQIVVTGFIASTLDGKRTTLGRNGSDFSGAIFAKLFKAKCLIIWTDVDGIFSADPNRVRSAFVIESLSYKEAFELAYFGAKVLHPRTIAPVQESDIPIYIKNSYNPSAKGTLISSSPHPLGYLIKGLTSIDDVGLINIEGTGMTGVSGIAAKVFQLLHQAGISIILISQASSEHSICFAVDNTKADSAVNTLNENLQFEIERQQIERITVDKSCAIMSAVGDEMVGTIGISGKLCDSLSKAKINIRAISQGSSERNISVVVNKNDINRSLQAVHASFYLSPETISIGIIGPGLVGRTLLQQIRQELAQLRATYQVNLYVRGIMNSKKMLLSHEAIDLSTWDVRFDQRATTANLDEFVQHILADDLPHAVIIDCTANQAIAMQYVDFIKKGIHIITPNKYANAASLDYYKQLKKLTQHKHNHYLYEATVCAGLPIINTLQDILKTGDSILKIEGIVSGTLSYIFNELAEGKTFSSIVKEARRLGYTEPDPREDLSGMDVARKLLCLAREIGLDVHFEDVKVHDLVPSSLKECSVDEFLTKLPDYDEEIKILMANAISKQEKLCYTGAIQADGTMHVAINSFPSTHPFARLKGTDNMLIFNTRRYDKNPLIIQGPGAGAEVTASGIFADLLRLVSYLS